MCSLLSKKQPNGTNKSKIEKNRELEEDQQAEEDNPCHVSSHLYLKPAHTTGTLDKAVVLRRIRHRRRVNKLKSVLNSLLCSPFASNAGDMKTSVPQIKWADDAFAAP